MGWDCHRREMPAWVGSLAAPRGAHLSWAEFPVTFTAALNIQRFSEEFLCAVSRQCSIESKVEPFSIGVLAAVFERQIEHLQQECCHLSQAAFIMLWGGKHTFKVILTPTKTCAVSQLKFICWKLVKLYSGINFMKNWSRFVQVWGDKLKIFTVK